MDLQNKGEGHKDIFCGYRNLMSQKKNNFDTFFSNIYSQRNFTSSTSEGRNWLHKYSLR